MISVKACRGDLGLHECRVRALRQLRLGNQQGAPHLPTRDQVTGQHQVRHAAGERRIRVGAGVGGHKAHHIQKGFARGHQAPGHSQRMGAVAFYQQPFGFFNLCGDAFGNQPAIARCFASNQVIGLNGGGALVDRQNLGIAVILGAAGFLNETHAAMHLHTQAGHFQAHLGAVTFDQGHQEFVKGLVLSPCVCIGVVVGGVVSGGGHCGHGAATLGVGAHGHEHAFDIGVVNDGTTAGQRAVYGAALHTLLGKTHGFLVGALGNGNALHAHAKAGRVHHDEHVLQTAVFLTHQVTYGTAVVAVLQHRGRAGLDAHLVFDADAMHVVASTQGTVRIDHELGHDKQADALDPFRRPGHAGQHQMDDVVGHVVLTPGDVNLGAKHLVAAVRLRLGPGAHRRQIAAGLGFGQVHGAGPFAADQLVQVSGLEFIRAGSQ